MKKILLILALLPLQAFGLADSSAPTKMQIPFGNSAGGAYIRTVPVGSQIGIQNGAASYTDGFPPLNFTPVNAGGVPPFGQDMNGILNAITQHTRWWAAGGPVFYDSSYQTAIGGYPKGSCVQSTSVTGRIWCSTVDNNTSNPDTGGANWQYINNAVTATNQSGGTVAATTGSFSGQVTSTVSTGTAPFVVSSTTPVANLSIGGSASSATTATTAANLSGSNLTGDVTNSANTITIANNAVTLAKLGPSTAGSYLIRGPWTFNQSLPITFYGSPTKISEGIIGRSGAYRTITKYVFESLNFAGNRHCAIYRNGGLVVDNTVAIAANIGNTVTAYFTNDTSGWATGDLLQIYTWTDNGSDTGTTYFAQVNQLVLVGNPLEPSFPYTYYYTAGAW